MPKRSVFNRQCLRRTLAAQHQIITRQQAMACGVPPRTLDRWITPGGKWQKILPRIYAATTGTLTQDQRDIAALFHGGRRAVITGAAALRRHNLRAPGASTVDILVPWEEKRQSVGFVRLHRTTRMPASTFRTGPIRFAGPARAAADAARLLDRLDQVREVVCEVVQRRACTVSDLMVELNDGPRSGSALLRSALNEIADGVRSVAEAELRSLILHSRLPKPAFNAKLYTLDGTFIAMVDAWWDEAGVAAEVDSRQYHMSAAAQDKDRDRHDILVKYGVLPLHFAPRRIKTKGQDVIALIAAAIDQGLRRPRLSIIALPADSDWDAYVASGVAGALTPLEGVAAPATPHEVRPHIAEKPPSTYTVVPVT